MALVKCPECGKMVSERAEMGTIGDGSGTPRTVPNRSKKRICASTFKTEDKEIGI